MPKELFKLDSTNSTRNYDPITSTIDGNSYYSFNICFPLKDPLKSLNSITLKSLEIPLILFNIRPLNGTTTISFTFTYKSFINITASNGIVAGSYTNVASLLTVINTLIAIVIPP